VVDPIWKQARVISHHCMKHAEINNYVELARVLIDRGAIVDSKPFQDMTPSHVACENNNVVVARMLLDRGADKCKVLSG